MIDLIYCAGGNKRFMQVASDAGWLMGVRSDKCGYDFPITFVDIHYKKPNWERHFDRVRREHPKYAIVPDLSEVTLDLKDIERAINQARQIVNYCQTPLIVPKLPGQIKHIPDDIAIAFSIKSSYGSAKFGLQELAGRRVHLLGGNPHLQMKIYRYLTNNQIANVISVDGNMAQKASQNATFWRGNWQHHDRCGSHEVDLMYECFQMSCQYIRETWEII